MLQGPVINPDTGHSYYLLTQNNWTGSEAEALTLSGHLVTINDAAENSWIFSNFSQPGRVLWLGLNDAATAGKFVWTSGQAVTYTNWARG